MLVALAQPPAALPANNHTLPPPFEAVEAQGDILLFRNDEVRGEASNPHGGYRLTARTAAFNCRKYAAV